MGGIREFSKLVLEALVFLRFFMLLVRLDHPSLTCTLRFSRGCVTPKQVASINDIVGGDDFSLLDGYDELSAENQEKIRDAVEHGHINDSDWKGVSWLSYRLPTCFSIIFMNMMLMSS